MLSFCTLHYTDIYVYIHIYMYIHIYGHTHTLISYLHVQGTSLANLPPPPPPPPPETCSIQTYYINIYIYIYVHKWRPCSEGSSDQSADRTWPGCGAAAAPERCPAGLGWGQTEEGTHMDPYKPPSRLGVSQPSFWVVRFSWKSVGDFH